MSTPRRAFTGRSRLRDRWKSTPLSEWISIGGPPHQPQTLGLTAGTPGGGLQPTLLSHDNTEAARQRAPLAVTCGGRHGVKMTRCENTGGVSSTRRTGRRSRRDKRCIRGEVHLMPHQGGYSTRKHHLFFRTTVDAYHGLLLITSNGYTVFYLLVNHV